MTLEERIKQEARRRSDKMFRESLKKVINEGPVYPKDLTFVKVDHLIEELEHMKKINGSGPIPITSFIEPLEKAHWQTSRCAIIKSLEDDICNRVIPEAS